MRSSNDEQSPNSVKINAGDLLAVMARCPVPGLTKTRLAAVIGAAAAARLSRAFLLDLEQRLRSLPAAVRWFFTPADGDFTALLRWPADCEPQAEGDLGTRMLDVFRRSFARGYRRVVVIGTDTPHIDLDEVRRAFEQIAPARVVFGPARDGGYYLIGLARAHDVFSGIAWSTPAVLAESREKGHRLGLDSRLLLPNFDIDEADDLSSLRELLANRGPDFLPATRDALASISAV